MCYCKSMSVDTITPQNYYLIAYVEWESQSVLYVTNNREEAKSVLEKIHKALEIYGEITAKKLEKFKEMENDLYKMEQAGELSEDDVSDLTGKLVVEEWGFKERAMRSALIKTGLNRYPFVNFLLSVPLYPYKENFVLWEFDYESGDYADLERYENISFVREEQDEEEEA